MSTAFQKKDEAERCLASEALAQLAPSPAGKGEQNAAGCDVLAQGIRKHLERGPQSQKCSSNGWAMPGCPPTLFLFLAEKAKLPTRKA